MGDNLDAIMDSYEFGWNITRSVLQRKSTYGVKTIFGDYIIKQDVGTRRDMEAERLQIKYTKMRNRGEKVKYCEGALDLLKEWDRIGTAPAEFVEETTYEDEFNEEDEVREDD